MLPENLRNPRIGRDPRSGRFRRRRCRGFRHVDGLAAASPCGGGGESGGLVAIRACGEFRCGRSPSISARSRESVAAMRQNQFCCAITCLVDWRGVVTLIRAECTPKSAPDIDELVCCNDAARCIHVRSSRLAHLGTGCSSVRAAGARHPGARSLPRAALMNGGIQ